MLTPPSSSGSRTLHQSEGSSRSRDPVSTNHSSPGDREGGAGQGAPEDGLQQGGRQLRHPRHLLPIRHVPAVLYCPLTSCVLVTCHHFNCEAWQHAELCGLRKSEKVRNVETGDKPRTEHCVGSAVLLHTVYTDQAVQVCVLCTLSSWAPRPVAALARGLDKHSYRLPCTVLSRYPGLGPCCCYLSSSIDWTRSQMIYKTFS